MRQRQQVGTRERLGRLRNDLAGFHQERSNRSRRPCGEESSPAGAEPPSSPRRRTSACGALSSASARERSGAMRRCVPASDDPLDRQRQVIIQRLRPRALFAAMPLYRHDKGVRWRNRDLAFRAHRRERMRLTNPLRQHRIAVRSSLPPNVPTPRSPASAPKLRPFSTVARYPANASRESIASRYAGSADSWLTASSARKSAVPSALELLIPDAAGRSLAIAMSAPRRARGKLRAIRRTDAATYADQSARRISTSGSSASSRSRRARRRPRPLRRRGWTTQRPALHRTEQLRPPGVSVCLPRPRRPRRRIGAPECR